MSLDFDPRDGFRIVAQKYGESAWLEASLYDQGEPVDTFGDPAILVEWDNFQAKSRGELARMSLVLSSVCRYLNTGGSWDLLYTALSKLAKEAPGGRIIPGFYLYDSSLNSEGQYEHVFVNDEHTAGLRWVEGVFVDPLTAADLAEEFGSGEQYTGSGDQSQILTSESLESA